MLRARDSLINYGTFLYLSLPILVFFFGWLHLVYACTLAILLILGSWIYLKPQPVSLLRREVAQKRLVDSPSLRARNIGWGTPNWQIIFIAGIAFLWVLFSGIGGFANQDWDHHFRNALFRDLITQPWPIYYSFPANYPDPELANHESALNYYLTYWLPAALVGKVFGVQAANVALLIWSYVGVLLILYYLNALFGFRSIVYVSLLFMGWSGLDVIGRLLLQPLAYFTTLQLEAYSPFAYVAITSDLYNVFNQAIPTWLITLWVFTYSNRLNVLPIAFLLAYSPFGFIGLVLLFGGYYVVNTFLQERSVKTCFLRLTSELVKPDSLIGIVCVALPFALFYGAHASSVPSEFFWSRYLTGTRRMKLTAVWSYYVTFFLEVGIYFLLIVWWSKKVYQSHLQLFWLCLFMLLFIPFWMIGAGNDFASRGSMPFLLMLCVLMIGALLDGWNERNTARYVVTAIVLLASWVTPVVAITRGIAFRKPPELQDAISSFAHPNVTRANNMHGTYPSLINYYAHDPKHHFFYKYLTKK